LAEANLERPTAGTDASTRTAATPATIRRTRDARASMACGLDISAGLSLPFIGGRFWGSVMFPAHRQTETLPEEPR
jgi:hypothetical protein